MKRSGEQPPHQTEHERALGVIAQNWKFFTIRILEEVKDPSGLRLLELTLKRDPRYHLPSWYFYDFVLNDVAKKFPSNLPKEVIIAAQNNLKRLHSDEEKLSPLGNMETPGRHRRSLPDILANLERPREKTDNRGTKPKALSQNEIQIVRTFITTPNATLSALAKEFQTSKPVVQYLLGRVLRYSPEELERLAPGLRDQLIERLRNR